ncbi:MAG: hypothetical protein C0514_07200 [Candidatus Puniceispirillum sp.]|nr:hypothetical protein [Candidatus Puniceispirillum sp.]
MAELNGAGDFAQSHRLSYQRNLVTADYQKAQLQMSSGQKAQAFHENALVVQESFNVKNTLSGIEQYVSNMDTVDARLQSIESSLDIVTKVAEEFRSRLMRVVQPGQPDSAFDRFCQDSLEMIAKQLNGRDSRGNYLLAGTDWATKPVDLASLPVPVLGGVPSTNYYKGDQGSNTVNIDDGQSLDYTIRADDPGLANLLSALKIGATIIPDYDESGPNMKLLRQAIDEADTGTTLVAELYENLGTMRGNIIAQENRYEDVAENLKELDATLNNSNPLEAWALSTSLGAQLQLMMSIVSQDLQMTRSYISLMAS